MLGLGMMCGSGMAAMVLGDRAIRAGRGIGWAQGGRAIAVLSLLGYIVAAVVRRLSE